jgi:hypothetical protein
MIGVNRILQGLNVTSVLGDTKLDSEKEKALRKKYIRRALEILNTKLDQPQVFTLDESKK